MELSEDIYWTFEGLKGYSKVKIVFFFNQKTPTALLHLLQRYGNIILSPTPIGGRRLV